MYIVQKHNDKAPRRLIFSPIMLNLLVLRVRKKKEEKSMTFLAVIAAEGVTNFYLIFIVIVSGQRSHYSHEYFKVKTYNFYLKMNTFTKRYYSIILENTVSITLHFQLLVLQLCYVGMLRVL